MCVKKREFFAGHVRLKVGLARLQETGLLLDVTEDDLVTIKWAREDALETRLKGNSFCSQPGCSRRPVKLCEWDGVSKVCDKHVFPARWDRESRAVVFFERHRMNVALPCRRESFWLNFLLGLHPRLGGSKKCRVGELALEVCMLPLLLFV